MKPPVINIPAVLPSSEEISLPREEIITLLYLTIAMRFMGPGATGEEASK